MIVVTAIEPAEYHRRRVKLTDTKSGETYEMLYGDSVSEETIRQRAPMLAGNMDRKRKRRKGTGEYIDD